MTMELVYVSRSVERMGTAELETLLRASRSHNQRQNISGLLLYDGYGTFIQVLEGDENQVNALFEKIRLDQRHTNIHILGRRTVAKRSFSDWRMGFRYFNESAVRVPDGYSDFLNQAIDSVPDSFRSFSHQLIDHFRTTTVQQSNLSRS